MSVAWFDPPQVTAHEAGALHPERPARVHAVREAVRSTQLLSRLQAMTAEPVSRHALRAVHDEALLAALEQSRHKPQTIFDADTKANAATYEATMQSASAMVGAAATVCRGDASGAFVVARPPGHHATPDRIMGFCFVNHIAVAARALQHEHGVKRIAIVDFDVHHGNGTQDVFVADPSVLYVSLHQYPYYPQTGAPTEVGVNAGAGSTLNIPMTAGWGGAEYNAAFEQLVIPKLDQFAPDAVLVSAGYDAHHTDPLGGMALVGTDFAMMTQRLQDWTQHNQRPGLAMMLEGGYSLPGLAESVVATMRVLLGDSLSLPAYGAPAEQALREFSEARQRHKLESIL
jgi:acetoin utilization deacetylase AcuC-like enzyme